MSPKMRAGRFAWWLLVPHRTAPPHLVPAEGDCPRGPDSSSFQEKPSSSQSGRLHCARALFSCSQPGRVHFWWATLPWRGVLGGGDCFHRQVTPKAVADAENTFRCRHSCTRVILRVELPECPLAKFAEHLTFKQPSLQTQSHLLSDGLE